MGAEGWVASNVNVALHATFVIDQQAPNQGRIVFFR